MTTDTQAGNAGRPQTSAVLTLAAAAGLLYAFRGVLWPFALAFALAILIRALSLRIVRALPNAPHWAIVTLTAATVATVAAIGMFVVIQGGTRLIADLPQVFARLDSLLRSINLPGVPAETLSEALASIDLSPAMALVATSLQDAASGLALTMLFLTFLVASSRMIDQRVRMIVAGRTSGKLMTVLERSVAGVQAYVVIQSLSGLTIALASGAVMFFVGLDNALFWTAVMFIFAFLPVVGVLLGSIGPILFALLQFPTIEQAVIIFVAIQIISFVVGSLILPKVQADSQNIDPAAGVLAIGIWTILWGIPGSFLAIPLTLAIMYALAQYDRLRWIAVLISNDGTPLPAAAKPEEAAT